MDEAEIIRVKAKDARWLEFDCEVRERNGQTATIYVPEQRGTWAITGGNDPWIYTLHPDDCARICAGGAA
jgi:hypothetical protein